MTPRLKFNLLRLPSVALDEVFKHMNVLALIELSLTSTKTGILIYQILQKLKLQLDFHHGYHANHISLLSGPRSVLQVSYHLDSARIDVRTTRSEGSGMVSIDYSGCFLYPIVRRQAETIKKVLSILFKFITSFHLSGKIVKDNFTNIHELLRSSNRTFPVTFESHDVTNFEMITFESHEATHYFNPLVNFSDMFLQMKSLKMSLLRPDDIKAFLEAWVEKKSELEEVSIKSEEALKLELMIFGIEGVNQTPLERVVKGKVVEKCYEIRREDGVKAIVYVDEDTFNLVNVNCLD